jgi:hypothetical protein
MKRLLVLLAVMTAAVTGAGTAHAVYGTYSQTIPTVRCTTHVDAAGRAVVRTIVPNTPGMFAPVEPMKVSWQPMLHRWNGYAWVHDVAGHVLMGLASVSTVLPHSPGFTINATAGTYYRVSIVYRWYSGSTVVRSTHLWAGQHVTSWKSYGYLGMANDVSADAFCQL